MSIAALQGWDAPMIYNYSQRAFDKPTRPAKWSTFSDPALTGMMPAAAVAFRQGHVAPAKNTYCLMLDRKQTYYQGLSPSNCATIRTLVEQSRLTIGLPDIGELDWDRKTAPAAGVKIVRETNRDFIPPGRTFVASDTGQLKRDWAAGFHTIDTPKTQAASGWIAGKTIRLSDAAFEIQTPKAALAVTSLDGKPIAESKRILITAIARVVSPDGKMPLLSEPVRGALRIRSRVSGLKLVPLAPGAAELPAVPLARDKSAYVVTLPAPRGTHWFLLRP